MSSGSCGTNDCMDGEVSVMAKSNSCTTEGMIWYYYLFKIIQYTDFMNY